MISIYTIVFNEELMLPYFIKHYRSRFPNCIINVYDNYSTDNTEKIALDNNCNVLKYDTGNKLSDSAYLKIKNHEWKKELQNNWVLICDVDEFLNITEDDLLKNESHGITLIKGVGYDMINMNPNEINVDNMTYGVRSPGYDKICLLNRKFIKEINYTPGCHVAKPVGSVIKYNSDTYNMYHMNYVNEEYKINRYRLFKQRLSDENIRNNWGIQYTFDEKRLRDAFKITRETAQKLIHNENK